MQKDIERTIDTAVSVYLQTSNERVRDVMRNTVITELRRNNLTRLWLRSRNYKVYLKDDGLGFDTDNVCITDHCGDCGRSYLDAKLLYVYHADTVQEEHVYGCMCGSVYKILWGA